MNYDPDTKEKLKIALNSYRMLGFIETLKGALVYLLEQPTADRFDEKYGVSTSGYVEPWNADIPDEEARSHAVRYVATSERVMAHILETALQGLDPRELSFVDLGCGKGRTLIMAAQHPFKQVVGVELSPGHSEIATQNVTRYLASTPHTACKDVRVACANALEFDFPKGDLFIYMYRPFLGTIVRGVADNLMRLQAATGRRILVAYCCPVEEVVFESHPGFVKRMEYQVISFDASWNLWECRAPGAGTS